MRVKCGCGKNDAVYAVYDDPPKPHCLVCMLEAVDNTIAIPVRTLDPWEMEKIEGPQQIKKAAH